tara:strand:- start:441589 stop:441882 length:294 start_codon:yes stop_codon:yes gene_type:complete
MKKKIDPTETQICGHVELPDGRMEFTKPSRRVQWLRDHYLQLVAVGDWTALYSDPTDGRLWVVTYPFGYMHGGGPPSLHCVSIEEAVEQFSEAFGSE